MSNLMLVVMLAVIAEGLVEYGKSLVKAVSTRHWKCLITQLCALTVSIVLCFISSTNLFVMIGLQFRWAWVGTLLTGIFASRGANYVNSLISRLEGADKPPAA